MTAPGSEYSHAAHIRLVTQAAREVGLKGAAFAVLAYLCASADFKKPTVRRSKANMVDKTGYCLNAVKEALRTLRAAGFIEAIQYETGGRERATVYVLRAGKGATNQPPLQTEETDKGGQKMVTKGARKWSQRGPETSPPSLDHSNDPSRVKGTRSAHGVANDGLDVSQERNPPAPRRSSAEAKLFSEDHRLHGLTVALDRMRQREAAAAQGAMNGESGQGSDAR